MLSICARVLGVATRQRKRAGNDETPREVLAGLLPLVRGRAGLTAQDLADRVGQLGGRLDRAAISKIESQSRNVTLDEALLLAAALSVEPAALFLPRDDDTPVRLAAGLTATAGQVRRWVRGVEPLPGGDAATFRYERPASDRERLSRRLLDAEMATANAERRLQVARARLDAVSKDRGKHDATLSLLRPVEAQRLDARLDVAYDVVAEATVDLNAARERLRNFRAEEGITHGER